MSNDVTVVLLFYSKFYEFKNNKDRDIKCSPNNCCGTILMLSKFSNRYDLFKKNHFFNVIKLEI